MSDRITTAGLVTMVLACSSAAVHAQASDPPPEQARQVPVCCDPVIVRGSESRPLPASPRDYRIWIEPGPRSYTWQRSFPDAVREAFAQWERAELPVTFTFVDDPDDANLTVVWRMRMPNQLRGRSTWWATPREEFLRGEIEIAIGGGYGYEVDHELVRGLALHEIGHLIGLRHGNDPRSVMSRTVHVSDLPRRDIEAARALYVPSLATVR